MPKKVFDPDLRYPDCMIADDEPLPTGNVSRREAKGKMDPVRYQGYFDAKMNRIKTIRQEPQYWEGVLIFASRKAKTNLRPIEEQPETRYLAEIANMVTERRINANLRVRPEVGDWDANSIPVPHVWDPPRHLPRSLNRLLLVRELDIDQAALRYVY